MTSQPIAIVSVSGGKDSTATALLALDEYGPERCRFVFADTGHEHPLTLEYLHGYFAQAVGPVITLKADFAADIERKRRYVNEKWPLKGVAQEVCERALSVLRPTGVPFLDLCLMKGRFPSRMAQFCTQELKRRPLDRFMLDQMASGLTMESWQGVRRDESRNRAGALDREMSAEGWWIVRPIAAWTGQQVVDFVRSRGIQLNPLYSMGMGRVGCMPCINVAKDELAEIARRFPEEVTRVAEWERLVGMASKRGRSSLLHHADGEGGDPEHAYRHCRIEAMIDWAKTSRGGRQYDLLRMGPASACSSAYGLCE